MTRTRFLQSLDELKEKLLAMGGLAEQAVDCAVTGFRKRESAMLKRVFEIENRINEAEREIDELSLDVLAMQQPMAVDLRFITAVMKINADLERVGDQAVNMAERVMELISLPELDLPADIPRMASAAGTMIRRSLQAFVERNVELAETTLKMDDVVDRMNDDIFQAMVQKIHDDPDSTRQALDVLSIARNLERVADHATNIAEDVIFWVSGADVRHQGPPKAPPEDREEARA